MTRLLCAADLHLHEWPGLAPVDRLADQEQVLDQIATVARERAVDALLLAGDIFHRPHPSPRTLSVFRDFARKLVVANVDVLAITGNTSHDIENADRYCALELFDDIIDVHRGPAIWNTRGVSVATLPSVPVATLVAARNGGDRDEVNADAAELLVETVRDLRTRCGEVALLLAHWSVSGASLPNGLPVDAAREPVLPLAGLEELGFDAVVLGHIHRAQVIDEHATAERAGPIFYCGSPLPLDFGEASFDHGVWLLDFETDELYNIEFVPLESRPFVTIDADITGQAETSGLAYVDVGLTARDYDLDGAIVRVRVRASAEQWRRVDTRAIKAGLVDGGAALVRFEPEIVRAGRARAEGLTDSLGELDAVTRYCDAQEITGDDADGLYALTKGYLEEVNA